MKLNKAIFLIVSLFMLTGFLWSLDNVATFNGSTQYIQFNGTRTYDTAFSGLGAVTLEVWIKPTSLQTGGTITPRNTVINIPRQSSTIGAHLFLVDNGRIRLDGRSTNENFRGVMSSKRVKTGVWTHIAGVLDFQNDRVMLYVNGVLWEESNPAGFASRTYVSGGSGTREVIGAGVDLPANYWYHGAMDELRIWGVARTQQQIRDNIYSTSPSGSGLMGYYKFDQDSGTTVNDSSTPNRNGTYNPSAGWSTGGIVPEYFFRTLATGNWTNPATWQASVDGDTWNNAVTYPIIISEASILTGHTVTLTNEAYAANLTVNGGSLDLNSNNLAVDETLTYTSGTISGTPIVNGYSSALRYLDIAENNQTISSFSATTDISDPVENPIRIRRSWVVGGSQSGTKTYTFYWNAGEDYDFTWSNSEKPFVYANGIKVETGHVWNSGTPRQVTVDYSLGAKGTVTFTIGGGEDQTLPIELSSFTANFTVNNLVVLHWITQSETECQGYYILRNTSNDLSSAQIISQLIPAHNTSDQQVYTYNDTEVFESGMYYYWLQDMDFNGGYSYHGPLTVNVGYTPGDDPIPGIPFVAGIKKIYPNPATINTIIKYGVETSSEVQFEIYNSKGQLVRSFNQGIKDQGDFSLIWNGKDSKGSLCPSGIYLVRMQAGKLVSSSKLMLVR